MKHFAKSIVVSFLGLFARMVLRRYVPKIIMVTGSVGKTSTKDAVGAVMASAYFSRKSEKSFNSEFGVPFTVFNVKNPWRSPLLWAKVAKSALGLLILPNHYPNMLVLEVSAEKPGDLAQILDITKPDAVVVTMLPEIPVHVEAYVTPQEVREEEFSPAYALPAAAPLIVPADDPHAMSLAVRTPARIISYGFSERATVRLSDASFYEEEAEGKRSVVGMRATATVEGKPHTLIVKGSVGNTQLLPAAAALAAAVAFQIPVEKALAALESYEPPPGRGRLLPGKNDSIIIDDSYNASPVAVEEALKNLKEFPRATRRIAVLGDMLELGRYSVMEHERMGALARESADLIIAVGVRARAFVTGVEESRMRMFDNSHAAAGALAEIVQSGDVILIKGSQSIRTERIVEALLANPSDAIKLVRQEPEWKRKS